MANITEKIERQITALEGKIDALSGNYLTNTWKRQREQQERDRKKEMYHSQIQVLQFLKQKSETDTLTLLEQNLTVAAFYEDMRCFSASKKYCKDNPYCKFQYPKPDDVRTKRLQKAGITDTDELAAAVECFDTLLQSAGGTPGVACNPAGSECDPFTGYALSGEDVSKGRYSVHAPGAGKRACGAGRCP